MQTYLLETCIVNGAIIALPQLECTLDARKQRRKELSREYKKTPKQIGAYCIRNTQDNKCFIGVSRDIEARLNRHRFMLNTNSEQDCIDLQAAWNVDGPEAFEFTVLETIQPPKDRTDYDPEEDLEVLKQLWLDELEPYAPQGYNKQTSS